MPTTLPDEVFLCHAAHDREFTVRLAAMLVAHGVPAWHSERNILGAQVWHDEIGAALERCDWFLIVLSPQAMESHWVKLELLFALEQKRLRGRIVPIVLTPCDHRKLSWTLSGCQMVNFSREFEAGCRELLRIWGLGFVPEREAR